jgi:hypothetical protein
MYTDLFKIPSIQKKEKQGADEGNRIEMKTKGIKFQHPFGVYMEQGMAKEFKYIGSQDNDDTRYRPISGRRAFFKKYATQHHYHPPKCSQNNCVHNVFPAAKGPLFL